jgi:malate dehydrogenase (oxaloacetate-decarboxylating)
MTVTTEHGGEALRTLLAALGAAGGEITGMFSEPDGDGTTMHVIHLKAASADHQDRLEEVTRRVPGVVELDVADQVFEMHNGGTLRVAARHPLATGDDLAQLYLPGGRRVAEAIAERPERVWELTGRGDAVAVLTNGTAVPGLGDIGPHAALPVIEGKALILKELADVDAHPVCVQARTAADLVAIARAVAPTFGAISLDAVAAPVCAEAAREMREQLDIPVFHDDGLSVAVVALAALSNAARVVGRPAGEMRVVIRAGDVDAGAAALLRDAGVGEVVAGDDLDRLSGADALVDLCDEPPEPEALRSMRGAAIVLAMSGRALSLRPEQVPENVRVAFAARGEQRGDLGSALVFPGFLRGLLDIRANVCDAAAVSSAADALARVVDQADLSATHLLPSVLDARVHEAVADAVRRVAPSSA